VKWQADVWRFTIAGKSRSGNWYEGQFRWFWTAYLAARWMALMCDWATPTKLYVEYDVRGSDEKYLEEQDSPYGIAWGVKKVEGI
jgi:hypothetical protein